MEIALLVERLQRLRGSNNAKCQPTSAPGLSGEVVMKLTKRRQLALWENSAGHLPP